MTPVSAEAANATKWSAVTIGLWAACLLLSALVVARVMAVSGAGAPFWACSLPAYLPRALALTSVLAPLLILAPWLPVFRRGGTSSETTPKGSAVRRLWPLLLIPVTVFALPDRTGFMGDYLIRQGAIMAGNYPHSFPQSLPLDRFLQGTVVPWFGADPVRGELPGARWMGLLSCLSLCLLSVRALGREAMGTSGSRLPVVILAGGGYLCLLTGYARDWVEFLPLTLLLLTTLRTRVTSGGPLSPTPEIALIAMLLLHRSALCLLPAYLIATAAHLRPGRTNSQRSSGWLSGAAALCLVVFLIGPRYISLISTFDLPRHAQWFTSEAAPPPPIADAQSMLAILNALLMLAPAAPLAWLGVVSTRDTRERWFLVAALLGWLPLILLLQPQQGPFRDYDVYAGFALTSSFAAALGLERFATRGRPLGRALLVLAAISTLQASLGLLLVSNSASATEARVRHGLELKGDTRAGDRAGMNDYLGLNSERRMEWSAAAGYFSAAAELAPSPARLIRAGRAAAFAGEWAAARTRFSAIIARDSTSTIGWCGYAATSSALGDTLSARGAERRLLDLCRSESRRQLALGLLTYAPALDKTGTLRKKLLSAR